MFIPIPWLIVACLLAAAVLLWSSAESRADGYDAGYEAGYEDGKPQHDSKTGRFTRRG